MARKRLICSFILGLFLTSFSIQLFSQSVSAAAPTDLDGQIATYKLYHTLDNCFNNNVKKQLSGSGAGVPESELSGWNIFDGQQGGGAIVSGGVPDGGVDCQKMMSTAASSWGLPDTLTFLKEVGWDRKVISVSSACNSGATVGCVKTYGWGPPANAGAQFQTAAKKYIGSTPSYASYFAYEDAWKTLGICGATVTAGAPDPTAIAAGAKLIWAVGADGTPTESTLTRTNVSSMRFGPASGPFNPQTKCSEVVAYLEDKNNATNFYKNLPPDLKKAWTGVGVGGANSGGSQSACGVDGIGWIVCPVMSFLGDIAEKSFNFISTTFLQTKSTVVTSDAVKAAWSAIRNIANVVFVIAFLIIIFSQLTGQGVTNYGVKKMLPRLIIAAVLMNLSMLICLIAVDVSNILGNSLSAFISGIYGGGATPAGNASGNGWGIAAIVVAAIAGGAILLLAITGPVLLAVVVAVLMIVLILIARMALIVVLIIISPLAFAAFLLPNTEQWFKKWRQMFVALLMVYPIIAVVFGTSSLVSKVINATAVSDPNLPTQHTMQLVAVGVAAIPLFVVPSLLKGSLNAAGSIGAKLSGVSSKLNGRIGGKVKDTSKLGQIQQYRGQQAKIRRAQIMGGTFKGSNRNPMNWGRNASSRMNRAINGRTGGFGTEQSRLGERINAKIEAEEVTAAKATIEKLGLTMDQMADLAKGTDITTSDGRKVKADSATQRAAISSVIQTGDHTKTRELIDTVGNSSDTALRAHLADNLAASSKRPGYVGGQAIGDIRSGAGVNSTRMAEGAIASNVYSAEKIATGDKDELQFIANTAAASASITAAQKATLKANAKAAQKDKTLRTRIGKNATQVELIKNL